MKQIKLSQNTNIVEYEKPQLIRQETAEVDGQHVDRLVYRVYAANETRARILARGYARKNNPTIKNIIEPEIISVEDTKQSMIRDFFPDTFNMNEYEIGILAVR